MRSISSTTSPARVTRPRRAGARFEALLTDLAASTATLAPRDADAALEAALGRAAETLGIDWIWRDADGGWCETAALTTGAPARFGSPAELPPEIRRRLSEAGVVACSALAVPFPSVDAATRALFAVSRDPDLSWSPYARRLRGLAALAATIERRTQAELALEAATDVTRWKASELVAEESDKLFRRTADALPVAIWMSDDQGRCTFFNKGWQHLTGRTFEEERRAGWLQSVHADDRAACLDAYLRAFEHRVGFRVEYRIQRQDGTYRWILDTGMPRYGSDGDFAGYVGGCVDISERKEAERLLRNLSHRLLRVQDQERRRIARELHDHLSQQLALLAIQLQHLVTTPTQTTEELLHAIEEAWRRTTEIASDLHGISHRLHPSKMEALGLVATVQAHCRDVSRQSLPVIFHHQNVPADIPPDRALNVFRVLEEALSNVIRHSGATEAHVSLVGRDAQVALRVSDNGKGFTVAGSEKNGMGLISMRERLQLLAGTMSIQSVPGQGTVVEARLPSVDARDARSAAAAHAARVEIVQLPARMTRRAGTIPRASRSPRRAIDS